MSMANCQNRRSDRKERFVAPLICCKMRGFGWVSRIFFRSRIQGEIRWRLSANRTNSELFFRLNEAMMWYL